MSFNLKIKIQHNEANPIIDTHFCSHSFTNTFFKDPFPNDIKLIYFDQNADIETLLDCIVKTIDIINENGGWRVIVWSKRDETNDIAFKQSETATKVTSSDINRHITSLVLYLKSL